MTTYHFTLFVRDGSVTSHDAERNLRELLDDAGIGAAQLERVDVAADPERAERAGVMATPTLIREHPAPVRRVVGDLSRVTVVRAVLGLPMPPVPRGASD